VAEHDTGAGLALAVAAVGLVPILAMWRIQEPERPAKIPAVEQFRAIGCDLRIGFRLRSIREGLVILASPMSCVALVYLFSGISTDYQVTARTTAFLSGAGWSVAGAVGAILGGRLVSRISAEYAYPLAGVAAAVCGAVMMISRIAPSTYTVGSTVYVGIAGFCGAGFLALIVDLTADAGHASSTWFAALWAMGNLPVTYMQWVDGQGYKQFGPRGMLAFDAMGNAVPALLFLVYLRRRNNDRKNNSEKNCVTEH
jgi:hypothetical protein